LYCEEHKLGGFLKIQIYALRERERHIPHIRKLARDPLKFACAHARNCRHVTFESPASTHTQWILRDARNHEEAINRQLTATADGSGERRGNVSALYGNWICH